MKKIVDGNGACSEVAYLFSEIASIYPITPSSPMASNIDNLRNKRKNLFNDDVKVIEMQSEAGAAGCMHGSLLSGALTTTFTASQGLLLMIPNMYKIAGEGLPGVIHVAARTIATHALSIFGDHSDIYATRQTGFCMLASTNVFDAQNMAAVAHLSAIKSSLPFLHFFDGFRTSHEINTIEGIDEQSLLNLIDFDKVQEFKKRSLNTDCNFNIGMAENEDIYFQSVEARNNDYKETINNVKYYMNKINELMHTDYKPFNYYGSSTARYVIVAMGSVCDTIKLAITNQEDYGLIEVHLYRPFSIEDLKNIIPNSVEKIAILDRTKEAGSIGEPLYLDVIAALNDTNIKIYGGRYGLSSKNTTPSDILGIYQMLKENPHNSFTVGIIDDITNLSIVPIPTKISTCDKELLIYGYGSDGMVSTSKDILHLVGENTSNYVQGYFEYDSKKSGGVTISHLRIGNKPINAPFYVDNPSLVVITKDEYIKTFELFNNLANNSIILINSSKNDEEIIKLFSKEDQEILKNKNAKIIITNADKIAIECGIKGKISKIMEMEILKIIDFNNAKEFLVESIKKKFSNKGEEIVNANIMALDKALSSARLLNGLYDSINNPKVKAANIFEKINKREGYSLRVSDLLELKNGRFPTGLAAQEKRCIATLVPKWNKENCIQCGLCATVCPHAVIRPIISQNRAEQGIKTLGNIDYNYEIVVSEADCTSCGLCINICPGKAGKKALTFGKATYENQEYANEIFKNHENPKSFDAFSIKGCSQRKPYFEFCGACAGCGETPYLKTLTQLFGKKMIIANATGCSSIYGGSAPSTPYLIPWANSLFEDNAEFGFGMYNTYKLMHERIKNIMHNTYGAVDDEVKSLYDLWLNNETNFDITYEVKDKLMKLDIPKDLKNLENYIPAKSIFIVGGDGWAYDIGFGGIDHVLSSGENVNIIVLDTEVYSNTGGQSSKSTRVGAVAEFANMGKKVAKKDLFRIAMSYPNTYVASTSFGANMMHTIKAFKEAEAHNGPSIIICYCPCIEQGIKGGMICSINEEKLAVNCGYVNLMRYNPEEKKLYLDSKEPDYEKYQEFLMNEVRYRSLMIKDETLAKELLDTQINNAIERYKYYKNESMK